MVPLVSIEFQVGGREKPPSHALSIPRRRGGKRVGGLRFKFC